MNDTMTWSTEQSPDPAGGPALLASSTSDPRLDALRDLVLMLLTEVESLQVDWPAPSDCGDDLQSQVQRFESDLIYQALCRTGGNQTRAARLLGVKNTTLNAKIRRYRIPSTGRRQEPDSPMTEQVIAA
jgi:DNA-binding NtrC family response regulator